MPPVKVVHFSDVLCVWAYVDQVNLFRLVQDFGDRLNIEIHFCSIFPDTRTKIESQWRERGGFGGYGAHVKDVAGRFDTAEVHADVWSRVQPRSSASPHLFIKAVELLENDADRDPGDMAFADRLPIKAARELRTAFFNQAQDIANWNVQRSIADKIGLDFEQVLNRIETGEAIASLAADYELAQSMAVQGSPTYILNEGRQKLFGNIGFGILSANIKELLVSDRGENASVCT